MEETVDQGLLGKSYQELSFACDSSVISGIRLHDGASVSLPNKMGADTAVPGVALRNSQHLQFQKCIYSKKRGSFIQQIFIEGLLCTMQHRCGVSEQNRRPSI